MREMNESGIRWVGKIPYGWKVDKNKHYFNLEKKIVGDKMNDYELLSLTKKGVIKKDKNSIGGKVPESFETYQSVKEGQIVMCLFDLDVSAVFSGLSPYNGMISPAYKIYNCNKNMYNKYAKYWFECCFDGRKYKAYSKSLRYVVNTEDFGPIEIVVPPIEEQHKIADFLDEKVLEIDNIIEKTKRTIEDYKKYKQAMITKTITKGINKNDNFIDSNNEWMGKISSKAKLKKIKYVCNISRGLFNHRPRNDERYYNGPYPFIQTGDVAKAQKYITTYSQTLNELGIGVSKLFPKGTLTMTIAANVGDVAILDFDSYFPDSVLGFVPNNNINNMYLYYIFNCMKQEFINASIVSTQLNLNIDRVKELVVPIFEDINYQKEIVKYLENKCEYIDNLVENKKKIIEELEQYKKSLIYECVTGKKEVI